MELWVDDVTVCERLMRRNEARLMLFHENNSAPTELDPRTFVSVAIGKDRLIPVSIPEKDGRPRFPLPVSDSQVTPYLSYRGGCALDRILHKSGVLERLEGRLKPTSFSPAAPTLANLARTGRGAAWAPQSLVQADLDTKALVWAGNVDMSIEVSVSLSRPISRQGEEFEDLWTIVQEQSRHGSAHL